MAAVKESDIQTLKFHGFAREVFEDLAEDDYEALKTDILNRGLQSPLDILPDGTILDGIQRWRILKELGFKKVPVRIVNLESDLHARQWIILTNLVRRQLTPTQRALAISKLSETYEIGRGKHLKSYPRDSMGHTIKPKDATVAPIGEKNVLELTADRVGVSSRHIADCRSYSRAITEHPDLKEIDSVGTVLNEYRRRESLAARRKEWPKLPPIKNLILGDCLEGIKQISDNSIDLLLTDPPFGHAPSRAGRISIAKMRQKGSKWDYAHRSGNRIFAILDELLEKIDSKLKPDAHAYIFTHWRSWSDLEAVVKKHYEVKNCLVYRFGVGIGDGYNNYRSSFGMIMFASKGPGRKLDIKNSQNFFESKRTSPKYHPDEKRQDTLEWLINNSTVEGETVLDPFAGSGSTLVCAERLKRQWWGIEIEPEWYNIARERISNLTEES